MCRLNNKGSTFILGRQSLILLDICADHGESDNAITLELSTSTFHPFSRLITMVQICLYCRRKFPNDISLDKHGRACGKKREVELPVAETHTQKRARIGPLNVDDNLPSFIEEPPVRSARSGRTIRMPRRLEDYVPHGDMSLAHVPPRAPTPPERDDRSVTPTIDDIPPEDLQPHPFQSETNKLGVFRRYTHAPSWHPKIEERLDLVCDSPSIDIPAPVNRDAIHEISRNGSEAFEPFSNISIALFMAAYFSGMDTKSEAHATSLARATQNPKFQWEQMANFDAHIENTRLDEYLKHGNHPFQTKNDWQDATVHIRLPVEGKSFTSENAAPMFPIHHLYHRRITDIVRNVCASATTASFHFTPFSMHWTPDQDKPHEHERVYADTYMSDSMIDAQIEVNALPREEGDTKERVVLGLMLASDSAQLTSFGTASVWPIYLMFANQPKQERVRPTCHAVHHLAYVPSVNSIIFDCFILTVDTAGCGLRISI